MYRCYDFAISKGPPETLTLCRGSRHHTSDLTEDFADATSHPRHNCTRRHRDETCHESILDEILAVGVRPNPQPPHQIDECLQLTWPIEPSWTRPDSGTHPEALSIWINSASRQLTLH
jgi:hypothetical protein